VIRKGNKYIMVVRTPKDLEDIRNNIDKYKNELKDGELIEVQISKSGGHSYCPYKGGLLANVGVRVRAD